MREQDIFIGNTSKDGVYHYRLKDGKLDKIDATKDFERCTYLAENDTHIYSVIEVSAKENNKNGYILAYKKEANKLIQIDKKSSYGQGPCHIEVNDDKKMLLISNYTDGYLTVMKMNDDGTIGDKIYSHIEEKETSHLHCVKVYTNSEFFFAVDLGKDTIIAYEIVNNKIKEISRVEFSKGTEPRHLAVGKNRLYVITEKSCELYTLKFENKTLSILNAVSILPTGIYKEDGYTGCAIKISKNFKNIYTTIRGHNSISVFTIGHDALKMVQNISCKGKLPRDLALDKWEEYVLVANQDSNDIAIFKREKDTGRITYKDKETVNLPTCIIVG